MDRDGKIRTSGELAFRVDCALLFELGERLVGKKYIALGELIKNAYDADATRIEITLDGVTKAGGRIVVHDDGTGMTFADVENAWMTIATIDKLREPLSPRYRRERAGKKGIGRFAARMLAKRLRLRTVADEKGGSPRREMVEVEFDWRRFAPGKTLETVTIPYERRAAGYDEPSGVTLELLDVRDPWTEDDVRALQRDIISLMSPFPGVIDKSRIGQGEQARVATENQTPHGDPGFSIVLDAPDFPEYSGKLEDRFLRSSYGILRGTLSRTGDADYTLRFRGDEQSYSFSPDGRSFASIGPTQFQVHFFVYQADYFAGLTFSVAEARNRANEFSGVRVYYDKFRVPPYGEKGDDWLDLDRHRAGRLDALPPDLRRMQSTHDRPMLLLPGNNQLFGGVFLSSRKNPELKVLADREGFAENEAFIQLKQFVRLGIDWMTVVHARKVAHRERKQTKSEPEKLVREAREKIKAVRARLVTEEPSAIDQRLTRVERTLVKAQTGIRRLQHEHMDELSMLRVLASAGLIIVVMDHELRLTVNRLRDIHQNLGDRLLQLPTDQEAGHVPILEDLHRWIEGIDHQTGLLNLLFAREPRTKRRELVVRPLVQEVEKAFRRHMEDHDIEFHNNLPPHLRTPPMYQSQLVAILLNLMSNALKAVVVDEKRLIAVWGEQKEDALRLLVCNTGLRAPKEKWEKYFEPFVGDSDPDVELGVGTGMGLKIVRDLVTAYGGTAQFVDPEGSWKTCVEIIFPIEDVHG